ncbi:hypothetical protein [Vibrio alginolyticus]|uniref:hypothetical protein n=1 Tax=Vibrio alginolyticus TaxID=663 RepID=UPI0021D0AF17
MKAKTLNAIIIQSFLLLLSSSVYGANDADIYLTFKPSTATTVNFDQQDRFVWSADSDNYYYSPLALPYLHREQTIDGYLCFDLIMKSNSFEKVIKERLGNIKNTAKLEMVPISGISVALYKRGNLYPTPLSEPYIFPPDVSYQKPTQENICLPIGETELNNIDNIEVRTNIKVRYLNESEISCSIIALVDKSLYQSKYADSQGNDRLVDEKQIRDALKEKLFTFSYQCRSDKGDEYSRPGGISEQDRSTLLSTVLSQLETEFVKWSDIETKVSTDLINSIPVEDLEYINENSNKTVTVEELAANVGAYLANRILEHNKLPPLVRGTPDKNNQELNTIKKTVEDSSKVTRKIKIPGGLNFISLQRNFDSQRIKYSYSDIVELGLLDSQLDPLHGPFTRNSERKYTDTPFDSNFPNKVIMPYYGDLTKLPDNWALCDGSEIRNNSGGIVQVPNLVDRYLKGVSKKSEVLVPKGNLPIKGKIEHTLIDPFSLPVNDKDSPPIFLKGRGQMLGGIVQLTKSFVDFYSHVLSIDNPVQFGIHKIYLYSKTIESNEPPFVTVYWICKIY